MKFCLFHLSNISDVCIFQSDLDLWRTIAAVSDDLWNSITWRPAAYLSSRSAFSWHVFPREICQKNVRTLPYTTGSNVHFANIVVTSKSNSQVLYWTHDSKHLWNSTVFSLSVFVEWMLLMRFQRKQSITTKQSKGFLCLATKQYQWKLFFFFFSFSIKVLSWGPKGWPYQPGE